MKAFKGPRPQPTTPTADTPTQPQFQAPAQEASAPAAVEGPTKEQVAAAAAAEERAAAAMREVSQQAQVQPRLAQGSPLPRVVEDAHARIEARTDGSIHIFNKDAPEAKPPEPEKPRPSPNAPMTARALERRNAEIEAGRARVAAVAAIEANRPAPSARQLEAMARDRRATGQSIAVVRPGIPLTALKEGNIFRGA